MISTFSITLLGLVALGALATFYWFHLSGEHTRRPLTTEVHAVDTDDGWKIKLYRYHNPDSIGEPAFLCHGIMENQWTFTSPTGRSMVDTLVEKGYDCWVFETRGHRSSCPPQGTSRYDVSADDYLMHDAPSAVAYIQAQTGHNKVHWIGHSMGGMLLYAYATAHGSSAIASGTTLGSPPGFAGMKLPPVGPLLLLLRVAPWLMACIFRMGSVLFPKFHMHLPLAPVNWKNMDTDVNETSFFNLVELLPYKAAKELSGWVRTNDWKMNNGSVNVSEGLKNLDFPLFAIYGGIDPFTPLPNRQDFYEALPRKDKRLLVLSKENGCNHDYSHVDLVFATNGRVEVYEPVANWLAAHAFAGKKAKVVKLPKATTKKKAHNTPRAAAAKKATKAKPKKSATKKTTAKKKASTKKSVTKKKTSTNSKPKKKSAKKVPVKKKVTKKSTTKKKTAAKKKTVAKR